MIRSITMKIGDTRETLRSLVREAERAAMVLPEFSAEAGLEASVRSRGDTRNNALADPEAGLFKTEVVHQAGS